MTSVGVVGAGLIGQKRIKALPVGSRLAAVCDVNQRAASDASLLVDNPVAILENHRDLVMRDDVDVVVIATTHASLAEVAVDAVSAGKHILIEKPGAISLHEMRRVQSVVNASGCHAQVGFNHRFHPSMLMARDLVRSGKYGEVLWIRARYGHGGRLGYDQEWRANRSRSGGGELLDQGSHLIDLTQFLAGEARLEFAKTTTNFWSMDVEDNAFIALGLDDNATAWLHASWTEWKNTFSFEITTRTAKIDIRGLGGSYGPETMTLYEMQPELGPPPSTTWDWTHDDRSWTLEMEDFIGAIDGRIPTGATISDAVKVHEIISEAYKQ